MAEQQEVIAAHDLSFHYAGATTRALESLNLSIGKGEFVLLTGPSGCGKTTFCRCLNGLIPNFHPGEMFGDLLVDGVSVKTETTSELSRKVGYVFQNPENQLFALTVEKDVAFGPENLGLTREEIRGRVDWAMGATETVGLKDLAPYELSGGQQQRVALAGVLAMKPSVIVLDEPTSFLDPRTAEEVMAAVDLLRRENGITVIVVEHRLDLVGRYAERIVVMDHGKIVADGQLEDVLDSEFDRLSGLGIGLPRVSLLWSLLKRNGLVTERLPTHVESAVAILSQRLRN